MHGAREAVARLFGWMGAGAVTALPAMGRVARCGPFRLPGGLGFAWQG